MYFYVHKCIRNDEHCHNCRQYYISIHNTINDIKHFISTDLTKLQISELCKNKELWIDEWERRKNGDMYNIIGIEPNKIYNLNNLNFDSYDSTYTCFTHLFLHINIDKSKSCPENINYKISFYTSYESVIESSFKYFSDHTNICSSKYKNIKQINNFFERDKEQNDGSGDYYKILKINVGEKIHLNACCENVQSNQWFN